ncbi:MAG TPA: prepilin-type N-terminal cleavage/methylation domain-containing protein [Candidatus Paceibacterota bacterium]|nr:prepilin-type N-terminal cleavage/methylation domain-containing protein [Candidatus Paceibacterota bacterium]HRU36080.1 prepilin-type N-terminal cleavage/methylation domain-containing protein [Candidatus Paceibacterota bacterium]
MHNKNKGFTLIEMLVVVAVIGLLASLILVGLSGFRTRGRDTRRIADIKEVQNGLEVYYMKNGTYPIIQDSATGWNELEKALTTAGINQIPNDPNAPTKTYYYSSDGQHYVIGVELEDLDSNKALLDKDVDNGDETYGVDCDDPIYCIKM